MSQEFKLPDLGEGIEAGDVVNVLVAEGDEIAANTNVVELETDKAIVELPCPHAGRVLKVHVAPGARVRVGEAILTLEASAAAPAGSGKKSAEPEKGKESRQATAAPAKDAAPGKKTAPKETPKEASPAATETPAKAPASVGARPAAVAVGEPVEKTTRGVATGGAPAPAGPATRRLARELGVDLHQLQGSGPSGRITMEDVKAFVRDLGVRANGAGGGVAVSSGQPPVPDFSRWGEIEVEPLKGIRRATSEAMSVAWRTVPHVTQFDSADVTDLENARRAHSKAQKAANATSAKITFTVLAVKACVAALQRFPQFNASLDAQNGKLIRKKYIHIGVAVDTEHGLMVPVVRNADTKSIEALAEEIQTLATRARERKLDLEDMRGGCFTITNLGGVGGTAFTPIVNWPEVAILGLSRTREDVVWRDGAATPRLILPLCLSYDHRVIDGADGARFTRYLASLLEEPFRLLVAL